MNPEATTFLLRIAEALERQVQQHEEATARTLTWRDENVVRHDRERAEEIAELRDVNERLLADIGLALKHNAAILELWKSSKLPGAVDPLAGLPKANPS